MNPLPLFALVGVALMVASCGGGGSPQAAPGNPDPIAAATSTANNNAQCRAIAPFYWEIGNASGVLASGSVGLRGNGQPWQRNDAMAIASASKWIYAAYAVERAGGVLDPVNDIPFLNFTSGYSNFNNIECRPLETVAACNNGTRNGAEAAAGVFHYNAGHFQTHAVALGLGPLVAGTLAPEVRSRIGNDVALEYAEPQLAGGARSTPGAYATFLRKMLGSSPALRIGNMLGSHAVCTLPGPNCNADAPPILPEAWHYSLGHWVEDDPAATPTSNFAYSSGGAFGFYPWIDFNRTLYGMVAREDLSVGGAGYPSAVCGRLIRLAWKTGTAQ